MLKAFRLAAIAIMIIIACCYVKDRNEMTTATATILKPYAVNEGNAMELIVKYTVPFRERVYIHLKNISLILRTKSNYYLLSFSIKNIKLCVHYTYIYRERDLLIYIPSFINFSGKL